MRLDDPGCLEAIAGVLQVEWEAAPYQVRGEPVYQASLLNEEHRIMVRLVIWPSLARVDAYLGVSFTVFKGIDDIMILPGVEAIFKRGEHDYLLVTRAGQVASSTG